MVAHCTANYNEITFIFIIYKLCKVEAACLIIITGARLGFLLHSFRQIVRERSTKTYSLKQDVIM
jgi:hypothetical protein